MNNTPFRTNGIEDPQLLFGRREELQNLCNYAEGLHQVEIIGARRYGKTCLIKSFITLQKCNDNRRAYPVYLDPYSDLNGAKGTANVYRYLTAKIISSLFTDGYIDNSAQLIDEYSIIPNRKWEKVYKQLENVDNEIDQICIFDETVEFFADRIHQVILLIFDEYEKAVDSFDRIDGLLHIRTLSGKPSTPITFWIVGASPWKKFIEESNKDVRGSGVFNGITQNQAVRPLNATDFSIMWNHECSMISDESKRRELESFMERVFVSSGGVPCFAKEIGTIIYIEGDYPQYNRLNNHFVEIEKNLSAAEIKSLRSILASTKEFVGSEVPKSITELEYLGIIKKNEQGRYFVISQFYADYVKAELYDERMYEENSPTLDGVIDEIVNAFYSINEKSRNYYGRFMFDPSNDTTRLYQDLRRKCDSRDKVPNFINSIYLLYWEGAKERGIAGYKLPESFKKTMFRKAMDRLRHVFGKAHQQDKLDTNFDQIDKATALKVIIGDSIEPQSPSDWLYFQKCMLDLFLQELKTLFDGIGQELREGKEFDGIIVEVEGLDGKMYKNVRYKYYTHPLRPQNSNLSILEDGDVVRFVAKERMDPINPQKSYWMAFDIRLK